MHFCSSSCNCCVLFTSFPCIQQQGEEGAKVGTIKATIFAEPDLPQLTEPLEGYLVSSVCAWWIHDSHVWLCLYGKECIFYICPVGACTSMKWHWLYLWNMATPLIRPAFDCLFIHTIAFQVCPVQLTRPGTGQNVSCEVGDFVIGLPACWWLPYT